MVNRGSLISNISFIKLEVNGLDKVASASAFSVLPSIVISMNESQRNFFRKQVLTKQCFKNFKSHPSFHPPCLCTREAVFSTQKED